MQRVVNVTPQVPQPGAAHNAKDECGRPSHDS